MMKKIMVLLILAGLISCGKGSDWVAKIEGKEIITVKEFDQYVDMVSKLNMSEGEAAIKKQDPEFRRMALDNLIANRVIMKEIEKDNSIKKEFDSVFELQALSKYFILKNVQPKIDVPSDEKLNQQYLQYKGELEKRGIKDEAQAKKLIVNEFQKAKYMHVLKEQINKVRGEYRKVLNDELEQNGIQLFFQNKIKEDPNKAWLFKIEDKTYTVADVDKFITAMVEINYGKEGLEKYQKDDSFKENVRKQIFEDFFGAEIIMTDAKVKGWINQDEVKSFVKTYLDIERVKYYMRAKISPTLEKPSDAEIKAYYDRFQKEIKKPYNEVKDYLMYRIFSEKAEFKAMKYLEKIKDGKKIEINDKYFDSKKDEKKTDKK